MKNLELPKTYNPHEHESQIYKLWESNNAFAPNCDKSKKPFCIIMPPPNANGNLHTGHGMYVVEDIMTRVARMQGYSTLWLPGTDHAGIETQVVFERELEKKGKSRFDYKRDEFFDMVMSFTKKNQHNILDGFKSLGFSADWSKLKFTLDDDIVKIVYDTFSQMHKDGLVYRGNRIVNWCPRCHAGFADIELKYQTRIDPLYYIKYGPFVVATVRPEPMFADTAIAVHPKDERYKQWIGKEVEVDLLWGKRKLKVIADKRIDPEFGTGVEKLTPAHDPNDWQMAQEHGLDIVQGIGTDGLITEAGGRFAGMNVMDARAEVANELEAKGLIDHIDMNYSHSVAVHDRCGTVIEPLVIEQWWVAVEKLKKPAIEAVKKGQIKFFPARFEKMYINWLENLRDWNISRQIVWGIQIPVYYNATNDQSKPEYIIAESEAEAEKVYGKGGYEAETDTFDTWFSSSQWPFATLQASGDFERYYPTTIMATARDILYLWVARMVMLGLYKTKKVPFEQVYLWGMITDSQGKKMSKSRGNVIDPLDFTKKFGTDALRMALTIGITPGLGGSISEEKVAGYRNFCNKLWNVARYTLSKTQSVTTLNQPQLQTTADHWMLQQLTTAVAKSTSYNEKHRYSESGQIAYSLLWSDFADRYIEYSKQNTNPTVLAYSLDTILRLLHPMAPFVTEAIWQNLPWQKNLLITEQWPKIETKFNIKLAKQFELEIINILATQQKNEDQVRISKLRKELKAKQNLKTLIDAKLQNKKFTANAPKQIVEAEEKKYQQNSQDIKNLEAELEKLNP